MEPRSQIEYNLNFVSWFIITITSIFRSNCIQSGFADAFWYTITLNAKPELSPMGTLFAKPPLNLRELKLG